MNLEKIRPKLEEFLENHSYHLFDLSFSKKDSILTILIDESLNMEELEEISGLLSNFMDDYDQELDNYFLDISSVGIERPIRNKEEIIKAIGSYIYIKTKDKDYYGYLDTYENKEISISYLEKNIKKKASIKEEEIKEMRYAVDFKGERQ